MKGRIRQLEEQICRAAAGNVESQSLPSPRDQDIETATSSLGGIFHLHQQNQTHGRRGAVVHGVTHKNRLFGQSHFVSSVAPLVNPHTAH